MDGLQDCSGIVPAIRDRMYRKGEKYFVRKFSTINFNCRKDGGGFGNNAPSKIAAGERYNRKRET